MEPKIIRTEGKATVFEISFGNEPEEIEEFTEYLLEKYPSVRQEARHGDIVNDPDTCLLFFVFKTGNEFNLIGTEIDQVLGVFKVPTDFPFNYWDVSGEWIDGKIKTTLDINRVKSGITGFKDIEFKDIDPLVDPGNENEDLPWIDDGDAIFELSFTINETDYILIMSKENKKRFLEDQDEDEDDGDDSLIVLGSHHPKQAIFLGY